MGMFGDIGKALGGAVGAGGGAMGAPAGPAAGAPAVKPLAGVAQGSVAPVGPAGPGAAGAPLAKPMVQPGGLGAFAGGLAGLGGLLGGRKMGGFMGRMLNNPAVQQKLQQLQTSMKGNPNQATTIAHPDVLKRMAQERAMPQRPLRSGRGFRGGRR
jgi:hypothetical protein